MKRFLVSLCLLSACFGAFAQKSYIHVLAVVQGIDSEKSMTYNIYLSGNLPVEIETHYKKVRLGEILNKLSENGYNMDFFSGGREPEFIFSKGESGFSSAIQKVRADGHDDVKEIARYNLQGMPVNEKEKGTQIIVYSNYTIKTIIVQ